MSDTTKLSVLDINYKTINNNYRYKVVHDFGLFSYLFDNCTSDELVRNTVAERVMKDIDHKEEK